jgi:hypothetical protein
MGIITLNPNLILNFDEPKTVYSLYNSLFVDEKKSNKVYCPMAVFN